VEVIFFFPQMYEKVEGGGGKGVHLGFLEMFFTREGFTRGNFFLQIHYGTGRKGCRLIFFFPFFIVKGEGGGG